MAKMNGLDKMSVAELKDLRSRIDQAIAERQSAERVQLRQKLEAMAAESGFSLGDLTECRSTQQGAGTGVPGATKGALSDHATSVSMWGVGHGWKSTESGARRNQSTTIRVR